MVVAQLIVLLHPDVIATSKNTQRLQSIFADDNTLASTVAERMATYCVSESIAQWRIEGSHILADLVEFAEQSPNMTTTQMIEAIRNHPQHAYLHTLLGQTDFVATYLHNDDTNVREFIHLIDYLHTQHTQAHIRTLLQKRTQGALSTAEEAELRLLLQHTTPHNNANTAYGEKRR